MMGAKSHADESSGPAEPSLPHQQAVDMTAPETFTTASRQPLTKGRRSLMGQGRDPPPGVDAFGCLRSLRARSALDGVSWVQGG